MSDPQRQAEDVSVEKGIDASARRASRPPSEDPLAELARILGEGVAHPVRPEHVVEIGRRVLPTKPAPQQVSDLEAELFESLRSSVAPEDRVRGDFAREVPPIIPQQPVDDHDIASLRAIAGEAAEETAARAPVAEPQPDPRLADYYAYDDGISAGSYDPAFAGTAPLGAQARAGHAAGDPRPTFEDFDTTAIAEAAREASPYTTADSVILPHSQLEEYEARQLPREGGRGGFRIAAAVVGVLLVGGGALAGWKVLGGATSRGPVTIHADGQPLKVLPDPGKAQQTADGEVSLKRDTKVDGSKIVSLQEDPVEHVAGRAADGREVRVINPGAQRPASADQPRTVKTVVVRPDGSIVTDGDAPAAPAPGAAATPANAPKTVTTTTIAAVPPVATVPQTPSPAAAVPPVSAVPPVAAVPPAVAPSEAPVAAPAVAVPMPVAAPPRPVAAPKPAVPVKPVAIAPAEAPVEAAPAAAAPPRPVKPTPLAPPKAPPAKAAAGGNAPLALGPIAARPAAPAEAAPRPTPIAAPAPVAAPAGGSGDWVVQISASKSEAEARGSLAAAQRRFSALAGKAGDVQRADLGAKGTFYRARVSAGSREAAAALCSQVKAQGGDCVVTRR